MGNWMKTKYSIASLGIKKRIQLAFFLSSIVPLLFMIYLVLITFFPDLGMGSLSAVRSTGIIMMIALLILSLSGYYLTMKGVETLITGTDRLQKKINKINEIVIRGLLYSADDPAFIMDQILENAVHLTESSAGAILLSEEGGMLICAKTYGMEATATEGTMIPGKMGIIGFCQNNKKGHFTNDVAKDSLFDLRTDRLGGMNVENTMIIPFYAKGEPLGLVQLINCKIVNGYSEMDLSLVQNLVLNMSSFMQTNKKSDGKRDHLNEAVGILSTMLEANGLGAKHHQNVAKYSDIMGEALLDNSMEKDDLHLAALLHDIGLIFIEPHLRNNQEIYQRHASIGADLLKKIPAWRNASICVQHHHENFNGTGYPEGLVGEDIPMASRILSIAEYYDYLTNASFNDKPLSSEEAKFEIINCSGTYFDPAVVEVFAQVSEHFEKEI
jgi:uncharacterized membrane protein (DUF485 family)